MSDPHTGDALLEVEDVTVGYDEGTVLEGTSLSVPEGTTVTLLGRNGVGKTTTLRTIVGLLAPRTGSVTFDGEDITGLQSHEIYRRGVVMVPENRGIFPDLTVVENLQVPIVSDTGDERSLEDLFEFFPQLEELQQSKGKHLSGGEQQMLTIARALRSNPRLLLLDEPSEGLAPQIVQDVRAVIETIADEGGTVLLVEQNAELALGLADYVYVMDAGRVVFEGNRDTVRSRLDDIEQYLGVRDTG